MNNKNNCHNYLNNKNFKKWNKNNYWRNYNSEKGFFNQIPYQYTHGCYPYFHGYPNYYNQSMNYYGGIPFNYQMYNCYHQSFYEYGPYDNSYDKYEKKFANQENHYNKYHNNKKNDNEDKNNKQNIKSKSVIKDINKINEFEQEKECLENKENKPKKIFIKIKNMDKMSEDDIMKEIDRQIMEELIKNISKNDSINLSSDDKKPIIVIKKKSQVSDMFSSLRCDDKKDEEKKENSCFIEDSDDENDDLIHSYKDMIVKKISEKKFNFIPIKNIIGNKEIKNIDDILKICNYYEKKKSNDKLLNDNSDTGFDQESINKFQIIKNEFKEVSSGINDILKNEELIYENTFNHDNQSIILSKKLDIIHRMLKYMVLIDKIIREDLNKIDIELKNEMIDGILKIKSFIEKNLKNDNANNYLIIIKGIMEELDLIHNTLYSKMYKFRDDYYNVNLEKVYKLKGPLIKLKKMIGLNNIKDQIIDMILYYLMEFEESNNNMLHMSIEGSPGCGKTKLAKILSKILCSLGILESDKVIYARRADLIGQYVGHTAIKTQKIIDNAIGGVLFIDEAYSLGSEKDKKELGSDSFSKECLDVLNQNLSDNKKKFICIIAGYSDELEKCFFSTNPGLPRRFPFRFKIDKYSGSELCKIFINKVNKLKWKLNEDIDDLEKFFTKNKDIFKYFGGDIETFIQDIKYTHSRRVICGEPTDYKIISNEDIKKSLEKFKERRSNEIMSSSIISSLYV